MANTSATNGASQSQPYYGNVDELVFEANVVTILTTR